MTVRVERDKETGVAVVTLDREHRHNAVDLETAAELGAAWRSCGSTRRCGPWC